MFVAHAETSGNFPAVVTFFWPGEDGGRTNCDGKMLKSGDAAVDFNKIPKGASLTISGTHGSFSAVASDCGGSDVISRKAARKRGSNALVIDIWVRSRAEAQRLEEKLFGLKNHGIATASIISHKQKAIAAKTSLKPTKFVSVQKQMPSCSRYAEPYSSKRSSLQLMCNARRRDELDDA